MEIDVNYDGHEAPGGDDVVAAEVAEAELARFAEAMDLDLDLEDMDDEERRDFSLQKRRFIRAVRQGHLSVDEAGQPVYRPYASKNTEPLVFREPDGAALMEMNRAKANKSIKQQHLVLAAITKTNPKRFADMKNRDLKVCYAVLTFFLGG